MKQTFPMQFSSFNKKIYFRRKGLFKNVHTLTRFTNASTFQIWRFWFFFFVITRNKDICVSDKGAKIEVNFIYKKNKNYYKIHLKQKCEQFYNILEEPRHKIPYEILPNPS